MKIRCVYCNTVHEVVDVLPFGCIPCGRVLTVQVNYMSQWDSLPYPQNKDGYVLEDVFSKALRETALAEDEQTLVLLSLAH